jgi:benzaldehyde dehydrogenase (NAD)
MSTGCHRAYFRPTSGARSRSAIAGLLHINDQTVADEPHVPFGGTGASGNGTRIGGPANWEEFTQWQWMTIKEKPNPYPF